MKLAIDKNVSIFYEIAGVLDFRSDIQFDVIGLSYTHFPADIRKQANHHLADFLKPGGIIIFEAFAKSQLGKPSGGPKNEEMLFSIEEIKMEFPKITFAALKEETIQLAEGKGHVGPAEVIRFLGEKFQY